MILIYRLLLALVHLDLRLRQPFWYAITRITHEILFRESDDGILGCGFQYIPYSIRESSIRFKFEKVRDVRRGIQVPEPDASSYSLIS